MRESKSPERKHAQESQGVGVKQRDCDGKQQPQGKDKWTEFGGRAWGTSR